MANLLVDKRDVKFVLFEQLAIEQLSNTAKYADYSKDMYDMVLEQHGSWLKMKWSRPIARAMRKVASGRMAK